MRGHPKQGSPIHGNSHVCTICIYIYILGPLGLGAHGRASAEDGKAKLEAVRRRVGGKERGHGPQRVQI